MENRVVSDTGPILHLHEINKQGLLSLFSKAFHFLERIKY